MKRIFLIMSILLTTALVSQAQQGLKINQIFGGRYVSDPSVTETMLSGEQRFLRSHKLTTFATFKGDAKTYASIIQPLVLADGAHAKGRNVRYREGKLQYAFFVLPSIESDGKKINRYLYYLNNEGTKRPSVMVIYFDGRITPDGASSLIKQLAK